MSELSKKKCVPCEGGVTTLTREQALQHLQSLPGWKLDDKATTIRREFKFKGFLRTMSFVNAVAWEANQQMHHPDMQVGYNYCHIEFTTHAINGLSENDFICAAKVNGLMDE